jgi:penicillin amidase
VLDVRITRHGPIVTDLVAGNVDTHVRENAVGAPLALRWVHADRPISQGAIEDLNAARDWNEFRAAALRWPSVGQNMVYADVDGHIGYQFTGTYPIRGTGSGVAPSPGWDPRYEWTRTIPPEDLPWSFDPPEGFLATANNKVVADDYPHHLTHDWEPAWRITRIHDALRSREKHSIDDMAELQRDTFSGIADALLRIAPVHHDVLRSWNRRMDAEQPGAALFAVWLDELARALFHKEMGDELFDVYHTTRTWVSAFSAESILHTLGPSHAELCAETLQRAWDRLADLLGDDPAEWRWGSLHRITFAHPIARALPPLAELFNAGPFEANGGDDTVNRGSYAAGEGFQTGGISSYRQIIDLGDFDRSRSVITTGCSGNPASPFYANQTPLWLAGEHHPMPFTPEAIAEAAVGTLVIRG